MRKTKRTGSGRTTSQRIVPLLVGGLVGVSSAVILSGTSATAAPTTVNVTFTADGVSPKSVSLQPGDTIVFKNDVDANGGGLLAPVTGVVSSVAVEVTNAAQSAFELAPGESQPITYEQPVSTTFTGEYQPRGLLGGLLGQKVETQGTVEVQSDSSGAPPVVAPRSPAPAPSPAAPEGNDTAGPAGPGQDQAEQPDVNYTPPGGNPAGGVVPPAGNHPGTGADQGAPADEPAVPAPDTENLDSLPQPGQDTPAEINNASSDSATSSLGLPAIMAVVLLSMVSAGLVRTMMVRHAGA